VPDGRAEPWSRFERVPEDDPDLTADQARAHGDRPFVWWVASASRSVVGACGGCGIWQLIDTTGADSSVGRIEHLHAGDDDAT
jgi:hypothetical protein